jgi:hypothetical protein
MTADMNEDDARHSPLSVRVECYAGHRGEQEPRRFFLGPRAVVVEEIVDRWLAPDHRYFKLRGDDGGVYILRHDEGSGLWELTMYAGDPPRG